MSEPIKFCCDDPRMMEAEMNLAKALFELSHPELHWRDVDFDMSHQYYRMAKRLMWGEVNSCPTCNT